MGKFKPKKFGITVLIISVAVFFVFLGSTRDQGFGISIPPALSTVTLIDGTVIELQYPNKNIACWINVNAKVLDTNGNVIGTEASSFLRVNPIVAFSLTDIKTQKDLLEKGGFEIIPSIKCATLFAPNPDFDPQDPKLFDTNYFTGTYPSFELPLKLDPANLIARVYSVSVDGNHLVDTFNAGFDTQSLSITNAESHEIGKLRIGADRILVGLEDGKYNSYQHIVLEGTLVLHWVEFQDVNFVIPIKPSLTRNSEGQIVMVSSPLIIYRELAVEKNVGEDPLPREECTDGQIFDPATNTCVPIQGKDCASDEFVSGNQCIKIGTPNSPNVSLTDFIGKLQTCIQSGQTTCLSDPSFIPLWLFGIGFIVIIGAVAQRKAPDIYGLPPSGF